ncbi:hypothetical protein FNF28_00417 [Cafeteria roenbergensis]|uniref:Uncharacterized protein n=2 Tax=Cafeteria roenbergensis TaxID=33653 RepID=A0A5A8E7D7_CAFRO|nr:hypothetical protein FNF28_00417 [Cafeteria roenbergensis]
MAADGEDGPKFGRRAGGAGGPTTGWDAADGEEDAIAPSASRPGRGTAGEGGGNGWLEEATTDPMAGGGAAGPAAGPSGGEMIQVIPDLDEPAAEADLTSQVAKAPKGPTRRVQTLGELNTQARLTSHAAAGLSTDADLALLTASLSDPSQVREKDEVWDPDRVLQEVAQQLAAAKEEARLRAEGPIDGDSGS